MKMVNKEDMLSKYQATPWLHARRAPSTAVALRRQLTMRIRSFAWAGEVCNVE